MATEFIIKPTSSFLFRLHNNKTIYANEQNEMHNTKMVNANDRNEMHNTKMIYANARNEMHYFEMINSYEFLANGKKNS